MPAAGTSQPVQNQAVLRAGTLNRTLPAAEVVAEQPSPELQAFAVIEPSPTATVEPVTEQEDAVVRAAVEAPPPVLPAYQVYQASDGDSVYSIADKFGISPDYVEVGVTKRSFHFETLEQLEHETVYFYRGVDDPTHPNSKHRHVLAPAN